MNEKIVAILATLDTKGSEALFIKQELLSLGINAIIIDLGFYDEPMIEPDVSREELLKRISIEPNIFITKIKTGEIRRDQAVNTMGLAAGKFLLSILDKLAGVIGIGGNQGTAAASIAMKQLPIGIPKIIVSTIASGNIRPYIEYKDIAMIFSVSDMEFGPNSISKIILTNAVAALVGMIKYGKPLDITKITSDKQRIAITTLGSTGKLTRICVNELIKKGYEPIVFHASGAGGSAMEELIEQGFFRAVLDLNLHEIVGEVIPDDIYRPMKPRLISAINKEIPLVIAPGGINFFVFGPPDTIKPIYKNRKTYYHNPYTTLVRLSRDELLQVADVLISKLTMARREIGFIIPLRGFSVFDVPGGPLYQPDDDEAFIFKLKDRLKGSKVNIVEVDDNINSYKVATEVLNIFNELMGS